MLVRAWRRSSGSGSAAVRVCVPAWIWMVRWRRAVRTNLRIDQPVRCSIQRETASAANTMVRCASEQCSKPVDEGRAGYPPDESKSRNRVTAPRANAGREGMPMLTVVADPEVTPATPASSVSLIDDIVRDGARRMLAAALEAEVAAYIDAHAGQLDEDGRRLV